LYLAHFEAIILFTASLSLLLLFFFYSFLTFLFVHVFCFLLSSIPFLVCLLFYVLFMFCFIQLAPLSLFWLHFTVSKGFLYFLLHYSCRFLNHICLCDYIFSTILLESEGGSARSLDPLRGKIRKYIINHHNTSRRQTTWKHKLQKMPFERLNITGLNNISASHSLKFIFNCEIFTKSPSRLVPNRPQVVIICSLFFHKAHNRVHNLIFMDPCIVDDLVEIPTRCSFVIEFIIPKFIERSTCFERHNAHHQEL